MWPSAVASLTEEELIPTSLPSSQGNSQFGMSQRVQDIDQVEPSYAQCGLVGEPTALELISQHISEEIRI